MFAARLTSLLVAAAGLAPAHFPPALCGAVPERLSLRWTRNPADTNQFFIDVTGLSAASLRELRAADWSGARWQQLLSVRVEHRDLFVDIGLPPMQGKHRVMDDLLRFEPQYPLEPGVRYRAVLRPEMVPGGDSKAPPVSVAFLLPVRRVVATTVVARVYPSANLLPENLLKFYVHFSAPMRGGHIYEHIILRNSAGQPVELPFLEIDEELWDPAMTRLTLFIDPGRIKREVTPLEEIGPALEAGKTFTLEISPQWKDAAGASLKSGFQKRFMVGPPEREPLDPARWNVSAPGAGSRDPVRMVFNKPLDHALAQRMIRVTRDTGELVEGATMLEDEERRWIFAPASAWLRGSYRLLVQTAIEDLAGNNIGKAFEVDLVETAPSRLTNATVRLPFEVR